MTRRGARARATALGLAFAACTALSSCASVGPGGGSVVPAATAPGSPAPAGPTTRWDHVVVVIMSHRSYPAVIGNANAPFLNLLTRTGVTFTNAYAVERPEQPNYLALFSGSTQGVRSNSCPHTIAGPNLATQLTAAQRSFTGYFGELPKAGFRGCRSAPYTTAHNPVASFPDVPASSIQKLSAFPKDFTTLPDVAFLVPSIDDDMQRGTVAAGDDWARRYLSSFAAWTNSHRSLLVITWDEGPGLDNRIPMIAVGDGVRTGVSGQRVDHYQLLATIEDGFNLTRLGAALGATPIDALMAP